MPRNSTKETQSTKSIFALLNCVILCVLSSVDMGSFPGSCRNRPSFLLLDSIGASMLLQAMVILILNHLFSIQY